VEHTGGGAAHRMLNQAAAASDPVERMQWVVTWFIAGLQVSPAVQPTMIAHPIAPGGFPVLGGSVADAGFSAGRQLCKRTCRPTT
jgi:hypothetical protein